MKNVSRDELVERADTSIYKLVVMVIKRALELAEGAPRLVDADINAKPTTVALQEVAQGKIKIKKTKE